MSFLGLLKDKRARTIFGKREIKIIEKQLNGLKLTQSEKNRLSRSVRVKLSFIKDISRFMDEFGLVHGVNVKRLIDSAVEVIKNDILFYKVSEIALFGSTVTRRRHLGSDVDISVKFDNLDVHESTKFRIRILGRLNDKADVQVYNVLPEKVRKEIDSNKIILFKK